MGGYLVVLLVAAGTTWVLTPVVRRLSIRLGAVVPPDARHVHERPMPILGGAAMFAGFLAAMAVASRIPQFHDMFRGNSEPLGVILAAGAIFVVGTLDDFRDVSPPAKLAGQVLAASLLYLMGVTMFFFRVPFADFVVLSPEWAPLVTAGWVLLMCNAVNLIDGLDGLAAGIVAIAGLALFFYADRLFEAGLLAGSNLGPLLAIITVGVCAGFLPFNFHPAKIMMGDSGALLLGVLMASTTIVIGGRIADPFSGQTYFFFAPLFIPLVILGVPIVDTVFAVLRRTVRRRSFAVADKDHLHHRLMRLGHGHRRSVAILWGWTVVLSTIALVPTYTDGLNALVLPGIGALALALVVLFHPGARRDRAAAAGRAAPGPPGAGDAPGPPGAGDADVVDLDVRRRA
jgi:UDP-GlcNAc:undecaprenyl-phosphate GlcNAc-1-phosphate transferase